MSIYISNVNKRKVRLFLEKLLEFSNLKLYVYKSIISPSQKIAIHRIRKIVKNSNPIDKKITGKKIIFNSLDGRYTPHTYHEVGIAKALQIRGNDVKMLICGGAFCNMCAGHFTIKKPYSPWRCKNCINFSEDFYKTTKVPYSTYKEYITDREISKIKNKVESIPIKERSNFFYKGVNIGYHAKTSADRYFVGSPPDKRIYDYVLKCELINSMISTDVAEKVVNSEKPDVLVTSHGCYSSWGNFSDYFINKEIRVCVWVSGYKKNFVIFDKHKLSEYFNTYYEVIRKKSPLNKEEEQELNRFLNKRIKGEEGDTAFYEFSKRNKNLEKMFNIDKYEKNFFIFPNVPWDRSIALIGEKIAFEDVYKWISSTIELFREKSNLQLIIKIHPAEAATGKSEKTLLDYINEKYPNLPSNIRTIHPKTDIGPYSLFPFIDVGIVCNGTIGLEMALNNIPVVVTGKVHYHGKGFTHDVSTEKEYSETLMRNITPLENQQTLAKIYAYFFFIKSFVPRTYVYYKNFLNLGWKIKSFDDLSEGKDLYLDHLCNYITSNKIYQNW
jgi:hypothetical protein